MADHLTVAERDRIADAVLRWLDGPGQRAALETFLDRMAAPYARQTDPDDLARHFRRLADNRLLGERGGDVPASLELRYEGDVESVWLGAFDWAALARVPFELDPGGTAPIVRMAVDPERRFAILSAYTRLAGSARAGEDDLRRPELPPGLLTGRHAVALQPAGARALDLWCADVSRRTLVVNLVETLQRHDLAPGWLDLRSAGGSGRAPGGKDAHLVRMAFPAPVSADVCASLEADLTRYLQTYLEAQSLFDIVGPIMIGPSSSHTAGANRIGRLARRLLLALREAGAFERLGGLSATLALSFRTTGVGHGTHTALGAGLQDVPPDDERLVTAGQPARLRERGVEWPGGAVPFEGFRAASEADEAWYRAFDSDCGNVAEVRARVDGDRTVVVSGFSLGGGIVQLRLLDRLPIEPPIDGTSDLYLAPGVRLGAPLRLAADPADGAVCVPKLDAAPPRRRRRLPFQTFEELIAWCAGPPPRSLVEVALETEHAIQQRTADDVYAQAGRTWAAMLAAIERGLGSAERTPMDVSGGDAKRFYDHIRRTGEDRDLTALATAMALASAEVNARMGRIVACPTAGACGVLPGVLRAWERTHPGAPERALLDALLVAALVGMVIFDDVRTAGAAYGCQAEIGVGSAMAAAGLAHLEGGDPTAVVHAATLALKNAMGLVCDPVAGLVEVPCIKRNGLYAPLAITAARLALSGVRSFVSPDEVVLAVREVGEALPERYRERSTGGLATTRDGKDVQRRFEALNRDVFAER
jgi:L-serine dehydratase